MAQIDKGERCVFECHFSKPAHCCRHPFELVKGFKIEKLHIGYLILLWSDFRARWFDFVAEKQTNALVCFGRSQAKES